MKVKIKVTRSQAEQVESILTVIVEVLHPNDFTQYCTFSNLEQLMYYLRKRIFLSQGNKFTLTLDHNAVYALYDIPRHCLQAVRPMDERVGIFFREVFETAMQKMQLEMNRKMASQKIYS